MTPSARSANLIAGDGTKNGLSRSEQRTGSKTQKQPLDRKSPIQVLCEPLFNARQTGLDKQQAVQEKPALLACYREGINAHLMAAIAMAEERPCGLLMPNQSLLYTGRVLACSQLNTMMHVCRELCGGQICVTSDFAAFQDPETAPWLEKYYTINADWRSEDRRRLLAFARDLLNSDYAGHRLNLPALRPVAAFCPPRRGLPEFRPGRTAPLRPQIRGPRHYFRPDPTSGIDPKPRHLVRALDCKIRPSATMPDR